MSIQFQKHFRNLIIFKLLLRNGAYNKFSVWKEKDMESKQKDSTKKVAFKQKLDKYFLISERGSTFKTEIIAGLTTFFAMAYIVVTNPNQVLGFNRTHEEISTIWYAVYVASILVAVVGTLLYAFYAKMPFAQACGMGLNSFFFTSFILPELVFDNDGIASPHAVGEAIKGYREGLAVIFLSGLLFLILSLTGLRTYIAKALPNNLKKAIPAGIGLFIAFLGLQKVGDGVGIVVDNPYTLVQLFDFHGAWKNAETPMEGWRTIAPVLIAILGLIVMGVLSKFKVKGSVIITILGSTVLYYLVTLQPPDLSFAEAVRTIQDSFVAFGTEGLFGAFKGFKTLFTTDGEFTWPTLFTVISLTITFCLVDMFDTVGTLYGTASQANMLDEEGNPINMRRSMNSDSIATFIAAILGTSTCTTFVESSAGVGVGGRTGFASLITAGCFFVCLFLTPVANIIPACATAPALIYIGVLMLKDFAKVDMDDITSAIPAFLTLVMMPLTYSISNGIAVGAISYVFIRLFTGKYLKKDIVVTIIAVLFGLRFFLVPSM